MTRELAALIGTTTMPPRGPRFDWRRVLATLRARLAALGRR